MKRQILSLATAMALTAGGAIFAQSTLNTPAPGPSQETKPGQTNNNLQNPGNPQMQQQPAPVHENGTTEGTAAESNARTGQTGTTTTTTGTTGTTNTDNTTGTATGTTGTMNNMDQTATPPAPTTTTETTTTTGTYNGTTGSTTTTGGSMDNTSTTSDRLPNTASDLPTVALMGLLALSAFFALRVYAKRQA
jgi:hypothetical protein